MAEKAQGYHKGTVDTIISIDDVNKQSRELANDKPTADFLKKLIGEDTEPFISIDSLDAGYGKMQILHDFSLYLGKGQSICLIGPNGAGKSTVLHTIYGLTNRFQGSITVNGKDITKASSSDILKSAGIAYILQDASIFPNMTVEDNLMMGGYIQKDQKQVKQEVERIFDNYEKLRLRKSQPAKNLSGGERRLLEITRSLILNPDILLIDEPSIGLEPRFIDMVFTIIEELKTKENKTILMVEQNAKKGLEYADFGYVLVTGETVLAGKGSDLLDNEQVGRLFLGG